MNLLCRLGLHRYRQVITGNRYTPTRLIRACTRCGLMHRSEEAQDVDSAQGDLFGGAA